jgi:hypothetical protein
MRLPNGGHAIVDPAKLRDYVLNPHHPRGRHKARVFASALGIFQSDAEFLRMSLLNAAQTVNATPGEKDLYGERFTLDFECVHHERKAIVRSNWIVLTGEPFPRLTTCFVL